MGKRSVKRFCKVLLIMVGLSIGITACASQNGLSDAETQEITATSTRYYPVPADFMQATRTPWNTYVPMPTLTPRNTLTPRSSEQYVYPYPIPEIQNTPPVTSQYALDPAQNTTMTLSTHCADLVYRLDNMPNRYGPPDVYSMADRPQDLSVFDPNAYFNLFTHLRMEDGYTLDFVSSDRGPLLYARVVGDPALLTHDDLRLYYHRLGISESYLSTEYLNHVIANGTPQSFLQLTLLRLLGSDFYLFWNTYPHDINVMCQTGNFDQILSYYQALHEWHPGLVFPQEIMDAASGIDFTPLVTIGGEYAQVRIVVFSYWSGFTEYTYWYSLDFPHQILDFRDFLLLPYDWGIAF